MNEIFTSQDIVSIAFWEFCIQKLLMRLLYITQIIFKPQTYPKGLSASLFLNSLCALDWLWNLYMVDLGKWCMSIVDASFLMDGSGVHCKGSMVGISGIGNVTFGAAVFFSAFCLVWNSLARWVPILGGYFSGFSTAFPLRAQLKFPIFWSCPIRGNILF